MQTATSNSSGVISSEAPESITRKRNSSLRDYTDTFFRGGTPLPPEKRDELILKYLPLIKYVAGRLSARLPSNVTMDDLVSSGILGLMDAAEKFDPTKNIQFKTYAEFRIRGSMLDELRSQDWIPRSIRKKMNEIERTLRALERALGRPAEDDEVAQALGIGMDDYYRMLEETRGVTFIDVEMIRRRLPDSSDDDLFDLIADDGNSDPFDALNLIELKEHLVKAIGILPDKEKLVVSLYYHDGLTMKEIGEILGYTESRISQMHTKAMMRIRAYLAEQDLELEDFI